MCEETPFCSARSKATPALLSSGGDSLECQFCEKVQRGFRNNNTRNNRNNNNRNNSNNRRPKQSGGCSGGNAPNYKFQGQDFLVSWRIGCSKFKQGDAERFCSQNGMRAISLDSRAKEDHFLGLIAKDRQRYFWTGGKVNNGD